MHFAYQMLSFTSPGSLFSVHVYARVRASIYMGQVCPLPLPPSGMVPPSPLWVLGWVGYGPSLTPVGFWDGLWLGSASDVWRATMFSPP